MADVRALQHLVVQREAPISRTTSLLRALESIEGELITDLPREGFYPVTEVRSTLLASSLQTTRALGLFEQYSRALPSKYHEQVIHTITPVWLPVEVAMAHYRAMDTLGLAEDEVMNIGRSVGGRLQGTFLGTLARSAKHAGLTPWALAGKLGVTWSRVFQGGGIAAWKLGPKDARIEVRGLPLMDIPYFRAGWRGLVCAGIESITSKCYVRECARPRHPEGRDLVVFWA